MRNWGGLGGLVFVAATMGVFAVVGDGPGETAESARDYYDDFSGLTVHALMVAATAGLVWFAAALYRVVPSSVALGCTIAGGTLLLATSAMLIAPGEANEMKAFSNDVSLLEVLDNFTYFLLTNAHLMIGLGAIAAGMAMRRGSSLPDWLGWLALVLGAIGLASAAFLPMFAIWLYVAVTGIILVMRAPESDEAQVG